MRQCEGQWSLYIERESSIKTHILCVCANPPRIIVNSESEKYNCLEINTSRELWTDDDDDSVMSGRSRLRSSLQSFVRPTTWSTTSRDVAHRLCCAIEEKKVVARLNLTEPIGAEQTNKQQHRNRWVWSVERDQIFTVTRHRNLP